MEEELYEVIGSFGRWQKRIYALFFYSFMVSMFPNFSMTFLAPNVPFRCIEPISNASIDVDELWPNDCTVFSPNTSGVIPCTRWEYDTVEYSDTLVNKWDLVCDREWLISFSKSVYMIGYMISVLTFGQLSDWIGRRPTLFICYVITCVGYILPLFSTSMEVFLIFRFFQALGCESFSTIGYVLVMEMIGPRHRSNVGITIQLGFSCGLCALTVIGYFIRNWFWFQVAIALPIIPVAFILICIPESPRWLLTHSKSEPLKKLIVCAAKSNKVELKEDASIIVKKLLEGKTAERKVTLLDLFRTPNMRCRILNMMYLFLVNAFLYYALTYNTNDLFGDRYVNFFLASILEFPSLCMLLLAMRWFGRRTITVTLMILSGAACISLLAVTNDLAWMTTFLSLAGRFCIVASFSLLYLYDGELFPTVVRSLAVGSCSTIARIGSIIAPFSKELGKATHVFVPNIVYSVLAISSGIFALWLPETVGHKLADTLDEGENAFKP